MLRIDSVIWQAISEAKTRYPDVKVSVSISELIDDEARLQVRGSDQLLKSAFTNLLENAYKYGRNGEVAVAMTSEKNMLNIEFSDEGRGIPESELRNIGKPFFRASNATPQKGSGVGLNLVRRIVEIHQGALKIETRLHQGTSVTIVFPLA